MSSKPFLSSAFTLAPFPLPFPVAKAVPPSANCFVAADFFCPPLADSVFSPSKALRVQMTSEAFFLVSLSIASKSNAGCDHEMNRHRSLMGPGNESPGYNPHRHQKKLNKTKHS
jgi:hypothetical protein